MGNYPKKLFIYQIVRLVNYYDSASNIISKFCHQKLYSTTMICWNSKIHKHVSLLKTWLAFLLGMHRQAGDGNEAGRFQRIQNCCVLFESKHHPCRKVEC